MKCSANTTFQSYDFSRKVHFERLGYAVSKGQSKKIYPHDGDGNLNFTNSFISIPPPISKKIYPHDGDGNSNRGIRVDITGSWIVKKYIPMTGTETSSPSSILLISTSKKYILVKGTEMSYKTLERYGLTCKKIYPR